MVECVNKHTFDRFSSHQAPRYSLLCYINYFTGGDGSYHLKILIPSTAAGAIIGKGGETIAQVQKDTGARIKMSKANDFYPGTSRFILLYSNMIVLKFLAKVGM